MTILVTYPFDANASLDACHLTGESHGLSTDDGTYRVIIPELAPFFEKGLVITHPASKYKLVEGVDYYLAYKVLSAASIANYPLYGGIAITNKSLFGEFIIDYRTVGANFVGIRSEVMSMLASKLSDPVTTSWESVLEKPVMYAPMGHEFHYSDILNKETLEGALRDLAEGITTAAENSSDDAIEYILTRIDDVSDAIDAVKYPNHTKATNNPHKVTAAQANAMAVNDTAAASFEAFNLTLIELAEYINTRGVTQDDIDLYVKRSGNNEMSGKMTLSDGKAIIRSESGDTAIDLSNNDITLTTKGVFEFLSDNDRSSKTETFTVLAGNNILRIYSTEDELGTVNNSITYNGHKLVSVDTVRSVLAGEKGNLLGTDVKDTDTIKLTGSGVTGDPIEATLKTTTASLTKRGMVTKLINSTTSTSKVMAPVPMALNTVRNIALDKVVNTLTINGKLLKDNVTLTADDIGLDLVDNTSDKNKPISDLQQLLLDTFVSGEHTHAFDSINFPYMTETVNGTAQLSSSTEASSSTAMAATPSAAVTLESELVEIETLNQGRMLLDVLDLRYWYSRDGVDIAGTVVTIPEGAILFMDGVDYSRIDGFVLPGGVIDLNEAYPNNYKLTRLYMYLYNEDGVFSYGVDELELPNAFGRFLIFSMDVSQISIDRINLCDEGQVYPGTVYPNATRSVGRFRELTEHLADPNPHSALATLLNKSAIGLDLIKNEIPFDGLSLFAAETLEFWNVSGDPSIVPAFATRYTDEGSFEMTPVVGTFATVYPGTAGYTSVWRDVKLFDTGSAVALGNGTYERGAFWRIGDVEGDKIEFVIGNHTSSDGIYHEIILQFNNTEAYGRGKVIKREDGVATTLWELDYENSSLAMGLGFIYIDMKCVFKSADDFTLSVGFQQDRTTRLYELKFVIRGSNDRFEITMESTLLTAPSVTDSGWNSDLGSGVLSKQWLYATNKYFKDIMQSGVIGFGFEGTEGVAITREIDCVSVTDGGLENKYVTATAAYNALYHGSNIFMIAGTASAETTLPIPEGCSKYLVMYSIATFGSTTATTLDGWDTSLIPTLIGSTTYPFYALENDLYLSWSRPFDNTRGTYGQVTDNSLRLAPSASWGDDTKNFYIRCKVPTTLSYLLVNRIVDDSHDLYVNGVKEITDASTGTTKTGHYFTVTPGTEVDLCFVVKNTGGGPSYISFAIYDGNLFDQNDYSKGLIFEGGLTNTYCLAESDGRNVDKVVISDEYTNSHFIDITSKHRHVNLTALYKREDQGANTPSANPVTMRYNVIGFRDF